MFAVFEKYDDLPLWSMYTGNKGLCIEFERKDNLLEIVQNCTL